MLNEDEILNCIEKLKIGAKAGRYNLNPNLEDLKLIIEGYLENNKKFGYPACPCRLASGNYEEDKDIVCPCDYRDDDVSEFGGCYCSLYVDDDIAAGKKEPGPIPDRRDKQKNDNVSIVKNENTKSILPFNIDVDIWRCPVCGYLCAKSQPPPKCPICGASKDRFELFLKSNSNYSN